MVLNYAVPIKCNRHQILRDTAFLVNVEMLGACICGVKCETDVVGWLIFKTNYQWKTYGCQTLKRLISNNLNTKINNHTAWQTILSSRFGSIQPWEVTDIGTGDWVTEYNLGRHLCEMPPSNSRTPCHISIMSVWGNFHYKQVRR